MKILKILNNWWESNAISHTPTTLIQTNVGWVLIVCSNILFWLFQKKLPNFLGQ
jgi:hypothetical protein